MAQNITLMGASYSDVPAVQLPKTGGGTALFSDPSITTAIASDVASGKTFLLADGSIGTGTASGGGSGGLTVLLQTSLGNISSTSTTATSLGISLEVPNINDYDALLVEATSDVVSGSGSSGTNKKTMTFIWLVATSDIGTKTEGSVNAYRWNAKFSRDGKTIVNVASPGGIYANGCTIANGTATIPMYRRYNSTTTGALNGNYTAKVYGLKLFASVG